MVFATRHLRTLATACLLGCWTALISAALSLAPAVAQEVGPVSPNGAKTPPRPVAVAGPELLREHEPVHIRDKDGSLVPVLGYTLEDFDELIDLKNQIGRGQVRPRYTLERVQIVGKAAGQFAELQLDFDVLVNATGWVRVPLRLREAVLLQEGSYKGPTRHFVEFDGFSPGYSAWFLGAGEQSHHLTLKALVPLDTLAGKQRMKLTAPRSTQAELRLTAPLAKAEGAVTGGALLDDDFAEAAKGAATEFTLRALDGEFELAWWPASRRAMDATSDLEAVGVLLARVDGRSVRTEATFTVRSSGGEYRFDGFRVRLPRGATLLPSEQTGVRLSVTGNGSGPRVVNVQLDEPTVGPIEVQLLVERSHNVAKKDEQIELAGFEVLDTVRQWGSIGVRVDEQWQLVWGERHPGVRRVETLPESLRQENLVAGFEYAGQPCSLPARVIQRETRIAVEPEYEVRIEATRVLLKARLKYRVPGAKVFSVDVDLRGWETDGDRIGPASLVDQEQVATPLLSPLSIPLRQPLKGEFELTIEASQPLPADATQVDFHLPHPTAHSLASAAVVVLPADNVSLTPRIDALENLKLQALPRKYNLPARQQEPLFFLDDMVQARFVGDLRVLPRAVNVAVASTLTLGERDALVEQKLSYKILHEPLDKLTFEAPRALADANQIEVSLYGRNLPVVRLPDEPMAGDRPATLRVSLTDEQGKFSERIGACEILIRYALVREKLLPQTSASLEIPLVMPSDGALTGNLLTVIAAPNVKAQYRDDGQGPWKLLAAAGQRLEALPGLRLQAAEKLSSVSLAAHLESSAAMGSTAVDKAWLQTQISAGARQDRAVYAFTSNASQFNFRLPNQAIVKDLSVYLNGQPVSFKLGADRQVSVALPKEAALRTQLLEMEYHFPNRELAALGQPLEGPTLDTNKVRKLYWQLVLPPQEHLAGTPPGFIGEFEWRWNGLYFGRQPLLDQAQLETWCGPAALRREDLPHGANVYLLSTHSEAPLLPLWTVGRSAVVFAGSLGTLGIGLALIYLPRARRLLALVAIVALAAAGIAYPEPALVVLQASGLGLALALVAGLLERIVSTRRGRAAPQRRTSSSIVERGALHAQFQHATAPSSTRSAVAVSATGPEANP